MSAVSGLCGMPIRARGGVYWLPATSADKWRALAAALSALRASSGRALLYSVTTVGDADTVKAISDSFIREADAEVARVEADIGTVGKRAAATRATRMAELAAMADYYARVLGVALDAVRARIDAVGAKAGAAALDAI